MRFGQTVTSIKKIVIANQVYQIVYPFSTWKQDTVNFLHIRSVSVKDHVDTLAEYKDYLGAVKIINPHEIRSMRESILNHFAIGESVIDKRRRFAKIVDIPYFGRIDFQEKSENCTVIPVLHRHPHISRFGKPNNLIYDWRAPIFKSMLTTNYELGEASYQSPSEEIKGDISLKRQYRIRAGKMEFMIESALTVHDDILQKELSANADDKMKNIVATIQREQKPDYP